MVCSCRVLYCIQLNTAVKSRIDVVDTHVRRRLAALQTQVAGLVQRDTAATIASLTGYAYLVEAISALSL